MPKRKGGSLPADKIQQVLENTYKETDDAPDGYTIDKDLSDDRVKVYKDMNSDQVIVAHRGSKGWRDWLDNARYAYSGDIRTSGTYQDAKTRQKKAIDKYGANNIISVGHSRAGKYVEELNKEQPVKEVITYNKAVHPNTIFQSNPENQTDIRTSTDVVSALSPLQFSTNKTITIPSGYDLLKAHKPSALSYLGQKLIGKGYKQMRVADMRKFVKAYKKEKYGERMTGGARLGKRELVSMMNSILEDDDLDEMVGGSVWTDFVKEFSARHNLKYACSLSKYKEPLKKAYKLSKEGKDWYEPFKTTSEIGVGTEPEPTLPTPPPPAPEPPAPEPPAPPKPKSKKVNTKLKVKKADKRWFDFLAGQYNAPAEEVLSLLEKPVEELKQISDGMGLRPPDNLVKYRYSWAGNILKAKYPLWKDVFMKKYGLTQDEMYHDYYFTKDEPSKRLEKLKELAKQIGADTPPDYALDIREYWINEILKKKFGQSESKTLKKKSKKKLIGGNRWTDFVKEYATRDNTTYGCALSDAGTKNAYKLFKDGKPWWFPKAKEIQTQTDDFVEPPPEPAPANIEPAINRIEEKIKQLEDAGRKKGAVSYNAQTLITDIAFVNLMRKYGGRCIVNNIMKGNQVDIGIDINTEPKKSDIRLDVVYRRLGETLKECVDRGVSLICIPLGLRFGKSVAGHANMLVYRPFQRLVERFEPHGSQYGNSDKDNKSINDQLRKLWEVDLKPFLGDVRFRDPEDICPTKKGFQSLESSLEGLKQEGGGFCSMWSFFLAELTFTNPTKTTKEIIAEAMDITKSQPDYLKSVIRGYVIEIETALDELLKTMGKPGFKFGQKALETMATDAAGFQQWLLGVVFDSKKYTEAPPQFEPLPGVILKTKSEKEKQMEVYKDKLNKLTKENLDTIFSLYNLKSPKVKKEQLIMVYLGWLEEGSLKDFGSTGLLDIDIILLEELYLKTSPNYRQGLANNGYFQRYFTAADAL